MYEIPPCIPFQPPAKHVIVAHLYPQQIFLFTFGFHRYSITA